MTNSNHPSNALPVYKHLRLAKASLSSQAGSTARVRPDGSFSVSITVLRLEITDSHGKGARAMTAAEIAERDLKARERRDKKQRPATPKHMPEKIEEEIQVPATPEQKYPPPSTAPVRLAGESGEGRGKRKRKMTKAYRQARQQGLL